MNKNFAAVIRFIRFSKDEIYSLFNHNRKKRITKENISFLLVLKILKTLNNPKNFNLLENNLT